MKSNKVIPVKDEALVVVGGQKNKSKILKDRISVIDKEKLALAERIIVAVLRDDKGTDITVIDLSGRSLFTEKMIIVTGMALRQLSAMADHIEEKLKRIGVKGIITEGKGTSDWVLLDTGAILVHLFLSEARELYGLEKMWQIDFDKKR